MKIQDNLLLIFTRNPVLGKCKTRLAKSIGNQAALDIYNLLLNHTAKVTQTVHATKQVYYSEEIWEQDSWDNSTFQKKLQQGNDLGERMYHAFVNGFNSGFKNIVIIGSDLWDINTQEIENAFNYLNENDFVIGPAKDGGYYLLGATKINEDIFKNKQWGNSTVLEETLKDLSKQKIKMLQLKNDIDILEDIVNIPAFKKFIKH